ncbi:MAG: tRNA (guanosine(46)-N7)-methyltransferase TrmB [Candidatus Nanopelagicales bacterium]|nr:tRNA (guanosine(46)-N7)-methyltransferase TrmB [Candidatus Nanopelagicales bacterium]
MLENARLKVEHGVIRTFHARRGRVTKNQIYALENYFSQFELPEGPWDFKELFGKKNIYFEIGCGSGESTIGFAKANPDSVIIAIEVHRPSISHLVENAHKEGLTNIRVAYSDGVQVLRDWISDKSLSAIFAFFPDPWPKKRHNKRRLFRGEIVELMLKKLKPGGEIIAATDWAEYGKQMLEVLPNSKLLIRPSWRPVTKYERKGLAAQREIMEIISQN